MSERKLFTSSLLTIFLLALCAVSKCNCELTAEELAEAYRSIGANVEKHIGKTGKTTVAKYRQQLQASGKFSDIKYKERDEGKCIREHAYRLKGLIQDDLEKGSTLTTDVAAAVNYLAFDIPKHKSSNWWVHLIGVPTYVYPVLYVSRDHVTPAVKNQLIERYFTETDIGAVWDPTDETTHFAGGNYAPRAFTGLVLNFVTQNLENFNEELMPTLDKEIIQRKPNGGNGFANDGCLLQHNANIIKRDRAGAEYTQTLHQLYSNNYGKEFLKYMAELMVVMHETPLDLGDDIEDAIFGMFFECEQWLYRGSTVEPTSVGRFLDSGKLVTWNGAKAAVLATLKSFQKVAKHTEAVEAALHRYEHFVPVTEADALIGNRHFFVADLMAHSRQSYLSTVRLLSSRSLRPETLPKNDPGADYRANVNGYYTGDGFMTVLVNGKELGSLYKEIFQAYDWARIPGTTTQYTTDLPKASTTSSFEGKNSYNDRDFVGGVSNGMEGAAFMDYARPAVPLRAKKSWFFFDDVIVCLGTNINLPQENVTSASVITTINQVLYTGEWNGDKVNKVSTDTGDKKLFKTKMTAGMWYNHDSIGYVPLLTEGELHMELDNRLADKIKKTLPDVSLNTLSLWINHGPAPCDSRYGYAVLPGATEAKTKEFAASPTTTIMNMEKDLQAICYKAENYQVISAAILASGVYSFGTCVKTGPCFESTIKEICTEMPIMFIAKSLPLDSDTKALCPNGVKGYKFPGFTAYTSLIQVAVSDPAQVVKTVYLTIPKYDAKNTEFTRKIELPQGDLAGSSVIECYKS